MKNSARDLPAQIAFALVLTLTMSGCVKMTGSGENDCLIFQPITWHVEDTDETISQIKTHNAIWKDGCK